MLALIIDDPTCFTVVSGRAFRRRLGELGPPRVAMANRTATAARAGLYTCGVAKRGYTRDTIRGGASDWDVSRPFSSYFRMLGSLAAHPVRFFEVLPKVSDVRAPALFLVFSSILAAALWLLFGGLYAGLAAMLVPLPLSFLLAGLYHLGSIGGRYGFLVTWRTLVYPFGFWLPLSVVPGLRVAAAVYAGVVLLGVGLSTVREIGGVRAVCVWAVVTGLVLLAAYAALYV